MTDLASRPRDPVVGKATPHESAVQHATGAAVYTDDLAPSTAHVLTHGRCSPPTPTRS